MVLKLVGVPQSTCTRRVAVILKEKQVPFEVVPVDFSKGEHKQPAYLKNQPFGKVPYVVEDDGYKLFESRAIGKYIALKYQHQGTPLVPDPTDLHATGLFEQAVSIETANFDSLASAIAYEKVFKLCVFPLLYDHTKRFNRCVSYLVEAV
jgi:glutathione S-transferase